MARLLDDEGPSEYLENTTTPPITAVPFTMACWFNGDDDTKRHNLMDISSGDGSNYIYLAATEAITHNNVMRLRIRGATAFNVQTTARWSELGSGHGVWQHACGTGGTGNNDWACFLNGTNKETSTASATPASLSQLALGRRQAAAPSAYLSGSIAEAAIYNVVLSDSEIAALASGFSPLLIRPQSIVAYWPLVRNDNDLVGTWNLTAFNTPSFSDHPGTIYPTKPNVVSFASKQLKDFSGFETGGFDEVTVGGSPTLITDSPKPFTTAETYVAQLDADDTITTRRFNPVSDYVWGFYARFDTLVPDPAVDFMKATTNSIRLRLMWKTGLLS